MAGHRQPGRSGGQFSVSAQQYVRLLERMAEYAGAMEPRPDCVVGVIRSGLFPAVYLSHQLRLPFFCASDVGNIPVDRLRHPLICDTSCWSGGTVRRLQARLLELGCSSAPVLSMYIRNYPRPEVDELHYLEARDHIMRFWYDYEGVVRQRGAGDGIEPDSCSPQGD